MRFRGRQFLVIVWLTMNLLLQFWDPVANQLAPIMKMACPWPTKQASNIGERKSRPLPQGCLSRPNQPGSGWPAGCFRELFQGVVDHHVPIMFPSCSYHVPVAHLPGGTWPRLWWWKFLRIRLYRILYTVKIHENTINIGPIRFDWVYIMIGLWIYSDYLSLVLDL